VAAVLEAGWRRIPTDWEVAVGMLQKLCGARVDGVFGSETGQKAIYQARFGKKL
jgi:hypothetical protein